MKIHIKPALCLLCVLVLAACATARINHTKDQLPQTQINERRLLLGSWMEEYVSQDGLPWRQHSVFYPSGAYEYQFRHYHADGSHEDHFEYGEWSISGDVFFTTEKYDEWDGNRRPMKHGVEADTYDAYYIKSLTPGQFVYTSAQSKLTFTAKKVTDDYVLPEKP